MKLALDTNTLTAFFQHDVQIIELVESQSKIYIPIVVYAEMLAGFRAGSRAAANQVLLRNFIDDKAVTLLTIGADTAERYSHLYQILRKSGKPVQANDLWIAALCLEHNCHLVTRDKHFDVISEIPKINA